MSCPPIGGDRPPWRRLGMGSRRGSICAAVEFARYVRWYPPVRSPLYVGRGGRVDTLDAEYLLAAESGASVQ